MTSHVTQTQYRAQAVFLSRFPGKFHSDFILQLYSMSGVLRLLLQDLQRSAPFDKLWISELMDHKEDLLKDSIMSSHIQSVQKIISDELGLSKR